MINSENEKGKPIDEEVETTKLVIPSIKIGNLANKNNEEKDDYFKSSSINLSMTNESDSASESIRFRKKNRFKKIYDDEVKSHFSPRSSVKIRVIDETDTDNNDMY